MKRNRRRIPRRVPCYSPSFDHVRPWLLKFLKLNYWRVAGNREFEDCLQDGYLQYLRLCQKYPEVNNQRHFFALFVRTYIGFFDTVSMKHYKHKRAILPIPEDADGLEMLPVSTADESFGPLVVLIAELDRRAPGILGLLVKRYPGYVGYNLMKRLLGFPQGSFADVTVPKWLDPLLQSIEKESLS